MSPEEFISRIMEAEPPEIYLMEDLKKPFTESSMMMSLTNLADKELVLMISWAKKIPGKIKKLFLLFTFFSSQGGFSGEVLM